MMPNNANPRNTSTDSWTKKTDMSTASARFGPGTCVINDKIYVIGGAAGFDVLPIVEVYNPTKNSWTSKTNMPNPRAGSACLVNGKIYYIGGALTIKPPHPAVATVEIYTPTSDK